MAVELSSILHGGFSHPLSRKWQAERHLTKVGDCQLENSLVTLTSMGRGGGGYVWGIQLLIC